MRLVIIPNTGMVLHGGPYRAKPDEMFGVKMAAEINMECDVNIPTVDFNVPDETQLRMGMMRTVMALKQGKEVYVGCMGGIGRTGLFMAAMVKCLQVKGRDKSFSHPINVVREMYNPHAVETSEQMAYIERLDVDDIQRWAKWV